MCYNLQIHNELLFFFFNSLRIFDIRHQTQIESGENRMCELMFQFFDLTSAL